jgi:hypothetical protein
MIGLTLGQGKTLLRAELRAGSKAEGREEQSTAEGKAGRV